MGAIKSNAEITAAAVAKCHSLLSDLGNGGRNEIAELVGQLETLNQVNRGAAERVIKIIDSLRSFARLDEAEWKVVDLHQGLDDTLALIQPRFGDRIRIRKSYGSVPEVSCYPKKMNQVFMTLLVNAEQAIKDDGDIAIETAAEGEWALIRISDTGVGIPPEHIQRIFDPGFTTKGVGVGTGLGLPICYQIIEEHQGSIEVVSQLGKGSTFTIKIPIRGDRRSPTNAVANLEGIN
jgi:signal transduction histidine kinase